MKNKQIISILISGIILIPIIFFPFSGDQSIFALGGKMLFQGKALYSDYIDLKPPMVFIFYGFITLFADLNEFGFRLFEYVWQIFTLLLLFNISKKLFNQNVAQFAVLIYSSLYTSMNFSQTLQPEGFMNLIVLLILHFHLKIKKNSFHLIYIGLLIGFATSFKFTFGILLIIILIDEFFKRNTMQQFIKNKILILISMAFVFILSFLPLLNSETSSGYSNVLQYLSFYSNYPPFSISLVKEGIIKLSVFFGDNYSILLLIATAFGILTYFDDSKNKNSIVLLSLFVILLLFSVATEKKFHEYHFLRMFAPLSVLAAVGFTNIINKFKNSSKFDNSAKLVFISFTILLILLSPLPRLFNIAKNTLTFFKDESVYNQIYEVENSSQILRSQYFEINNYFKQNIPSESLVILIATGSNQINALLYGNYRISSFSQSCFYFGKGAPSQWAEKFKNEYINADYLIVQNNDSNPLITGHNLSSFESINEDIFLNEILRNYFVKEFSTKNFLIFKKVNNER